MNRTHLPTTNARHQPSPYAMGYRHTFNGGSPLDGWPNEYSQEQAEQYVAGVEAGLKDYEKDGFYGERATQRV